MSCLHQFPSQYSIPPACFYNMQGLSQWLNQNPSKKQYFTGLYPYLYGPNLITSTLSSFKYNVANVPLGPSVISLSQGQSNMYNQQLQLFHKIYTHNSNAYVNYACTGEAPMYYTFKSYQEKTQYNASVGLVNELYPFKEMSEAPTLNWSVPFPLF